VICTESFGKRVDSPLIVLEPAPPLMLKGKGSHTKLKGKASHQTFSSLY
jgi:hypothetical protein